MRHKVASFDDFREKNCKSIEIEGTIVGIFKVSDKFYAIDDTCTHAAASLSEGAVENNEVECPWHGARFDLETGKALTMPATEPVNTYKVVVENNDIYLEIGE